MNKFYLRSRFTQEQESREWNVTVDSLIEFPIRIVLVCRLRSWLLTEINSEFCCRSERGVIKTLRNWLKFARMSQLSRNWLKRGEAAGFCSYYCSKRRRVKKERIYSASWFGTWLPSSFSNLLRALPFSCPFDQDFKILLSFNRSTSRVFSVRGVALTRKTDSFSLLNRFLNRFFSVHL